MIALITGASSGIGRDMAKVLAKKKYDVILVARSEDKLKDLKKEIEKEFETKAYVMTADVSKEDVCYEIYNNVKEQFGKIQVTIPSISFMKAFDSVISPLFSLILENEKENIHLASLRDSLLPRLMSGELDVSNLDL